MGGGHSVLNKAFGMCNNSARLVTAYWLQPQNVERLGEGENREGGSKRWEDRDAHLKVQLLN